MGDDDNVIQLDEDYVQSNIGAGLKSEDVLAIENEKLFQANLLKEIRIKASEYFPDFRHNTVLRFQSLLSVNTPNSVSDIWAGVGTSFQRNSKSKSKVDKYSSQPKQPIEFQVSSEKSFLKSWSEEKCVEFNSNPNLNSTSLHPTTAINSNDISNTNVNCWRIGPAKILFDSSGIPIEVDNQYHYNFLKKNKEPLGEPKYERFNGNNSKRIATCSIPLPTETKLASNLATTQRNESLQPFFMISQKSWEDNIIINPVKKHQTVSFYNCGKWISVEKNKDQHTNSQIVSTVPYEGHNGKNNYTLSLDKPLDIKDFYSRNDKLIMSKDWVNDIISEINTITLPNPKEMILDSNDSEMIFDYFYNNETVHKDQQNLLRNNSKLKPSIQYNTDKQPFNISNDEFYLNIDNEKGERLQGDGIFEHSFSIEHSIFSTQLNPILFPVYLVPYHRRKLYRPQLPSSQNSLDGKKYQYIIDAANNKRINQEKQIIDENTSLFCMRSFQDLSAIEGTLILFEYCEEYPPLLNMVGMASKIITYYRKTTRGCDNQTQIQMPYGDTFPAKQPPNLLGKLIGGQRLSTLDNDLFTAPIFSQSFPLNDFLLIRNINGYFLRRITNIFTIGQENPKLIVPHPNSRQASNIMKDLFQIWLYRMFNENQDNPKRINMRPLSRSFQHMSENLMRKSLRTCANPFKDDKDTIWVLKPNFHLPLEEELRSILSPETMCTYYSMLSGEQRLKDAGYTGNSFFVNEMDDEDSDEENAKIEEEIYTAPWHTTKHFIAAKQGKYALDVAGISDPTGCGKGFSYIKMNKRMNSQNSSAQMHSQPFANLNVGTPLTGVEDELIKNFGSRPKANIRGTDADLRKLTVNQTRAYLKNKFNIPDSKLNEMKRWDCIRKLTELSNNAAMIGEGGGVTKFARGVKVSQSEQQDKYRKECQRIFELQNIDLSSNEVMSTDDDSSTSSETEIELVKDLENIISKDQSLSVISKSNGDPNPKDLQQLVKQLKEHPINNNSKSANSAHRSINPFTENYSSEKQLVESEDEDVCSISSSQSISRRTLLIKRTYIKEGKEYIRQEIVRNVAVIDAYVKLKTDKGNVLRSQLQDQKDKEEMKREKRRLCNQLRHIKVWENKERMQNTPRLANDFSTPVRTPFRRSYNKTGLNTLAHRLLNAKQTTKKCSACGEIGHLRSNRSCPHYNKKDFAVKIGTKKRAQVAMTEEEQDKLIEINLGNNDDLVRAEGTKIVFKRSVVEQANNMKREALKLKFPKTGNSFSSTKDSKNQLVNKLKKRTNSDLDMDTSSIIDSKKMKRRRPSPLLTLSNILDLALEEVYSLPNTGEFMEPVSLKKYPNYRRFIKVPMDLNTIRENINDNTYSCLEDILEHLSLLVINSMRFNGPNHQLTDTGRSILNTFESKIINDLPQIRELEMIINPIKQNSPQTSLSIIFRQIARELSLQPNATYFLYTFHSSEIPMNSKQITDPICLHSIYQNCKKNLYRSRDEFLSSIDLLVNNCIDIFGIENDYSSFAENLRNQCLGLIEKHSQRLSELEQKILIPNSPIQNLNEVVISEISYIEEPKRETNSEDNESTHNLMKQISTPIVNQTQCSETIEDYDEFNLVEEEITYDFSDNNSESLIED